MESSFRNVRFTFLEVEKKTSMNKLVGSQTTVPGQSNSNTECVNSKVRSSVNTNCPDTGHKVRRKLQCFSAS